jgi:ribonuclease VapC
MIVDTSALVAILRNEPEARRFVDVLENASIAQITAPAVLELCMVMLNTTAPEGLSRIRRMLQDIGIVTVPFTAEMADIAVQAFLRFGKGKGRGHKAQLNFGDCMSYAASKVEAMPLLFKGEDFGHTDVERVL